MRAAVLHEYGTPRADDFNFAAPPELRRDAYARLAEAAADGGLSVEVDALALEQVGEAWERLARGSHAKIVLVPGAAKD